MEFASGIESLISSLALTEGWLFHVAASVVPVFMVLGLRMLFMFRMHHSWITWAIRFFGGVVPLFIGIYFLFVFAGSSDVQIVQTVSGSDFFVSFGLGLIIGGMLAYAAGRKFEPWLLAYLDERVQQAGRSE